MARPRTDAREKLLAAAVEYVAAHGVADVSLRQLAEGLGTSHRMLVFHFGSKEQLLVEVVRAVEARERNRLASLFADPSRTPAQQMRAVWEHYADPAQWPHERLFFEIYAQALRGRAYAKPFLDEVVDAWVGQTDSFAEALGPSARLTVADVRLGIAVTRGLLLDLLATGDRAGVDAAVDRYAEMIDATDPGRASRPPSDRGSRPTSRPIT